MVASPRCCLSFHAVKGSRCGLALPAVVLLAGCPLAVVVLAWVAVSCLLGRCSELGTVGGVKPWQTRGLVVVLAARCPWVVGLPFVVPWFRWWLMALIVTEMLQMLQQY